MKAACATALRLPAESLVLSPQRVEAIRALRRLRMSTREIAELLGMALSTVSRWLLGGAGALGDPGTGDPGT